MAKKSKKGEKLMSDNAYNETGTEDTPEQKTPYHGYDEVMKHHGSDEGADLTGSVNSRSGGIMGHGRKGDPDPMSDNKGKR